MRLQLLGNLKEIETVDDVVALQEDLDDLVKWENEWSAEFQTNVRCYA